MFRAYARCIYSQPIYTGNRKPRAAATRERKKEEAQRLIKRREGKRETESRVYALIQGHRELPAYAEKIAGRKFYLHVSKSK